MFNLQPRKFIVYLFFAKARSVFDNPVMRGALSMSRQAKEPTLEAAKPHFPTAALGGEVRKMWICFLIH